MKLFKLVFVLVCSASFTVMAEETNSPVFKTTITTDFFNRYVGPSGLAYTKGAVYQPSVTVEHESGLYLSVWGSGAFKNQDKYGGNEVDYVAGWAGDIGPVSINAGVGYYDFYELCNGRRENSWAMFIEVSKEYSFEDLGLTLTPSIRFEEDIPEPGSSYRSNFYTTFGFELRKKIIEEVEIFLLPALTYDNGIYGERCTTISGQIGADISVYEGLVLKPSVTYYLPFQSESEEDRDNELVFGIGLEYSF
jgi:hypothetical protein